MKGDLYLRIKELGIEVDDEISIDLEAELHKLAIHPSIMSVINSGFDADMDADEKFLVDIKAVNEISGSLASHICGLHGRWGGLIGCSIVTVADAILQYQMLIQLNRERVIENAELVGDTTVDLGSKVFTTTKTVKDYDSILSSDPAKLKLELMELEFKLKEYKNSVKSEVLRMTTALNKLKQRGREGIVSRSKKISDFKLKIKGAR